MLLGLDYKVELPVDRKKSSGFIYSIRSESALQPVKRAEP
jgi:hypothetical protein